MRVVIAHNYYQQPGGEDACVAAEAALLEANGHDVARFSLDNDDIAGMSRLDLAARTVWSRPASKALSTLLAEHRPQVVHFHNTFPLMSPAVFYAARRAGAAVVLTLHNFRLCCPNALLFRDGAPCEDCLGRAFAWPGIAHKCYRDSALTTAAIAVSSSAHRLLGTWANRVDAYIALSEFAREKLIAGGLPADKLSVKPNFVYPDPGEGAAKGDFAVFVGRLSHEKGLDVLLDAWRRPGIGMPLRIIGDGPLAGRVAEAAAANPTITWLKQLPLEQVYEILGQAACAIVPSQCYETFGRVIVEAFAKATPVIASRRGAMAELVAHRRNGLLVAPGDPAELADAVASLAVDPSGRAAMRRQARATYEANYTADANHEMMMAIYAAAIARRHRSSARVAADALPDRGIARRW